MNGPERLTVAAVLLMTVAAGCGGGGASKASGGSSTTAAAPAPSAGERGEGGGGGACAIGEQGPPKKTVSASFPTALAFAPDGRLFWAERGGTIKVWQDGTARTFATVDTVTTESGGGYSERGLLGLAVSPTFADDHFVYAFLSDSDRSHQSVARFIDCAGKAAGDPTTLVQLPAGDDCCHKGGRLAFGPDGKLYVTLGEEHTATAAQDTSDVRGKVLRYNRDGTVPADNPFGAGNPVWAFGFRNPFGIAFSPTGQLALTVNGPTGDAGSPSTGYDTVVASVAKGTGYQWPRCYGYSHPNTSSSCGDGQREPDWSSEGATIVPTGATFVNGSGPAAYANRLVFCTFTAGMKVFEPASPRPTLAPGPSTCQLDVKQGPDNALYYSDTGHIYRLG